MQRIVKLSFFTYFLFFGCSSSDKTFHTYYDPDYKVVDKGGKNVLLKSRACSVSPEKAISEAKKTTKYNLRSVIGTIKHRKKLKIIRQYHDGKKYCVEILARVLDPF